VSIARKASYCMASLAWASSALLSIPAAFCVPPAPEDGLEMHAVALLHHDLFPYSTLT
jgi:hypothetical protein